MAWRPDPKNPAHRIGGTGFMFRELNDQEEHEFREHARLNGPGDANLSILHPVCREEWEKQAEEKSDLGTISDFILSQPLGKPEAVDDRLQAVNLDNYTIDPAEMHELANTYSTLAAYAGHKARSMELRLEGDVECALSHEACMERLYKTLPEWARW